jgi:peptidoglycan/xylan/chitin deacetylase (PgdA/CDA1 family)
MLMLAGAAVAVGAGLAYAARSRSSTLFAPSVYHGDCNRRSIALTFDDGPSPSTARVLELLARYGIPATFFVCGTQVRRNPNILRNTVAAGHEIGNHSDTHARLWMRSPGFIYDELERAQEAIREHAGVTPALFRAPYGVRWFGLREAQRRLNLLGVMWTAIGRDWRLPGPAVAERIVGGASNGAIICLHDGRELDPNPDIGSTLDALERAIPILLERGFRFETVNQLLCPRH